MLHLRPTRLISIALACALSMFGPTQVAHAQCEFELVAEGVPTSPPSGLWQMGDYTLLAWGDDGFYIADHVLDLSPRVLGHIVLEQGPARRVVSRGDTALVIAGQHLVSIDCSSPFLPVVLDSLNLGTTVSDTVDMVIEGRYVYIAVPHETDGRLKIVDVGDPDDLRIVHQRTTSAPARAVAVDGDLCYVATDSLNESLILDVSSPQSPVVLTSSAPGGYVVQVSDSVAFLGTGEDLRSLDLSDPTDPRLLDILDGFGSYYEPRRSKLAGSTLVVGRLYDWGDWDCEYGTGMRLDAIDVSDPVDLPASRRLSSNAPGIDFAVAGNKVILPWSYFGLKVWDLQPSGTSAILPSALKSLFFPSIGRVHCRLCLRAEWIVSNSALFGFS